MAQAINRLSAVKAKNLTDPGMHADGGGLYLKVKASGAKSWTFIYQFDRKRREIGLGGFSKENGLAEARDRAAKARKLVSEGIDPAATPAPAEPATVHTFGQVATDMLDTLEEGWKNPKHRQQWRNTLTTYAASIWDLPVEEIRTDHVLKLLKPIWSTKNETATRVRGRVERVLNVAKVRGLRPEDSINPAAWAGHLALMLPKPTKLGVRGHHAAMPFEHVGAFLERLGRRGGIAARALELTILTVPRTNECIGARAGEFDMAAKVWTIPAERMKAGVEHQIPLSSAAVAVVEPLLAGLAPDDFLFRALKGHCGKLTVDEVTEARMGGESVKSIAARAGVSPISVYGALNRAERPTDKPISNMAMDAVLRAFAEEDGKPKAVTVHGFRSSFRDWAGEVTDYPDRLAEQALAHLLEDKSERAYRRGTALERRRAMMEDWAGYLTKVVTLRPRASA